MALEIDTDDSWNLYNLINVGDLIKASAYRYIIINEVLIELFNM